MSIGSGLAAQIGIATETTVNTPVAVTTFTEFNTETLDARPNFVQGEGLRAGGLVPRAARRLLTSMDGGGDVEFDVPNKGLGKWLQHCLGSFSTVATQQGATTAYQQIHNLGSTDGHSFTLQKGIPDTSGAVNPLTFAGCKVMSWEFSSAPNAIAKLKATIDAMSVQPTGAGALGLQTASYSASTGLFGFHQASVTKFSALTVTSGLWTPTAPAAVGVVRNISIKGGQPKDNTRWQAGSTTKAEALVNAWQPITGQIDVDFDANSMANFYTPFAANTSVGLQVTMTGPNIASTYNNTLQFTMPACFFESGTTAKVSGPGVVTVSYPFTVLDDGTNGALQVQVISTDVTV